MRNVIVSIFCLGVLLVAACAQSQETFQPEEGIISGGEYFYAPLGWRIAVPPRWNVMSQEEVLALAGKGRGLIEKASGVEVVDVETHLLNLRYDASHNGFTSSILPFDASAGFWSEQVAATYAMYLAGYKSANIPVRSTRGSESIGGVQFELMKVSMLDRNDGREVVQQHSYLGRIGSHWVTATIATVDAIPRAQMLDTWRNSEFSRSSDAE